MVVIGLDPGGLTGQDASFVQDYAANLGLSFPIVIDSQGSYNKYVSVSKIAPFPLDVVVGKDGVVTLVKRDFDIEELVDAIQQAL